jgi:hypothetical protein
MGWGSWCPSGLSIASSACYCREMDLFADYAKVNISTLSNNQNILTTYRNSHTNPFLRLMLLIGLVEVGTYKALKQPIMASKDPKEVAVTNKET